MTRQEFPINRGKVQEPRIQHQLPIGKLGDPLESQSITDLGIRVWLELVPDSQGVVGAYLHDTDGRFADRIGCDSLSGVS